LKEVIVESEKIEPIVKRIEQNSFCPSTGIDFINIKYHLLLTCAININYYLLRKSSGNPVRDHPVIRQILRIRGMLEKLRPIDNQYNAKIDKILARMESEGVSSEKDLEENASKTSESSEELLEAGISKNSMQTNSQQFEMKKMTTKRAKFTGKEMAKNSDLDEELAEYSALSAKGNNTTQNENKKRSFNAMVATLEKKEIKNKLPLPDNGGTDAASKRRKLEDGKPQTAEIEQSVGELSEEIDTEIGKESDGDSEGVDEVYQQNQQHPPIFTEEDEVTGKRKITTKMEKNISLRKKAKKQNKNPRVKNKLKYKKALVRRGGQVQKMRDKSQKYHGERTGIKTNVVKSTPL